MATRYLVTGGDGIWGSTNNWSASSGGASGASFPLSTDDVILDANSAGAPLSVTVNRTALTLTCTGYTGLLTIASGSALTVGGNITLATGMTLGGTGRLQSSATAIIVSAGLTLPWTMEFVGAFTRTISGVLTCNILSYTTLVVVLDGDQVRFNSLVCGVVASAVSGTSELRAIGTGTISMPSVTTGRIANNIRIMSGAVVTLSNTLSVGGGTFTIEAGATVITTGSTLILQAASQTVSDAIGVTWNNVTVIGGVTHTLLSDLKVSGVLSGGAAGATILNGFSIVFSGTSITSGITIGTLGGTTVLRITSTCTVGSALLTTGNINLPTVVDAPGKTITITPSWKVDIATWRVNAGTIVNAAGQQWLSVAATAPRAGRVINQSIQPGSNPRLFFRAWDGMVPNTTLNAAGISAAYYRRQVSGVWGSQVAVGALTDGTEFQAYSVGRVIKTSDALGNLYSIDAPLAATDEGADAIRLSLTLVSGTASVDVVEHYLAAARDTVTELRKIPRATAAVTAGGSVRRSIGANYIDETVVGNTP